MADPDDLRRLTRRLYAVHERLTARPTHWRPAADVYRTREGWLVKFELAGVRPEQLELRAAGRYLTVHGQRMDTEVSEGREFYRLEIAYSRFQRTVELPCNLDQARLVTEYHAGMLLVRIITEG
jgi:HSP20 family protein